MKKVRKEANAHWDDDTERMRHAKNMDELLDFDDMCVGSIKGYKPTAGFTPN